jgi:hypothetical protein
MTLKFLLSALSAVLLPVSLCVAQTTAGFLGTFTMQTEKHDGKRADAQAQTAKVNYAITDQKIALTFDNGNATAPKMKMIYDQKQQTITSYTVGNNSDKRATVMPMPSEQTYYVSGRATASATANKTTLKATDEVKNIAGYECKKYIAETSNYLVTLWATDQLHLNVAQLMSYMGAQVTQYDADKIAYLNGELGTALESEMVHKISHDKLKLTIQDIQNAVGHAVFDLSGYQITDMSKPKGTTLNK